MEAVTAAAQHFESSARQFESAYAASVYPQSASKLSLQHSFSSMSPLSPGLVRSTSDSFRSPSQQAGAGLHSPLSSPLPSHLDRSISSTNMSFISPGMQLGSPGLADISVQESQYIEWLVGQGEGQTDAVELPSRLVGQEEDASNIARALLFSDDSTSSDKPATDTVLSGYESVVPPELPDVEAFTRGVLEQEEACRHNSATAHQTPLFDTFNELMRILCNAPVCSWASGQVGHRRASAAAKATAFAGKCLEKLWPHLSQFLPTAILHSMLQMTVLRAFPGLWEAIVATREQRLREGGGAFGDGDAFETQDLRSVLATQRSAQHSTSGNSTRDGGTLPGPADLSMPFNHAADSKTYFRSKEDAMAYNQREKCRDLFISLLREFRDIGTSFSGSSWDDFLGTLHEAVPQLRALLHPHNVNWFAKLFVHELMLFAMHDCVLAGHADSRLAAGNTGSDRVERLSSRLAPEPLRDNRKLILEVKEEKPEPAAPIPPASRPPIPLTTVPKGAWAKKLPGVDQAALPTDAREVALQKRLMQPAEATGTHARPNSLSSAPKRAPIMSVEPPSNVRSRGPPGRSTSKTPISPAAAPAYRPQIPVQIRASERFFVSFMVAVDSSILQCAVVTAITRILSDSCRLEHVKHRLLELGHKTSFVLARQYSALARLLAFLHLLNFSIALQSGFPADVADAKGSLAALRYPLDLSRTIETALAEGTLPLCLFWIVSMVQISESMLGTELAYDIPELVRGIASLRAAIAAVADARGPNALYSRLCAQQLLQVEGCARIPPTQVALAADACTSANACLIGKQLACVLAPRLRTTYTMITAAPRNWRKAVLVAQTSKLGTTLGDVPPLPRSNSISLRKIKPTLISNTPAVSSSAPASSPLTTTQFRTALAAAWFRQRPELHSLADAVIQLFTLRQREELAAPDLIQRIRAKVATFLASPEGSGDAVIVDCLTQYVLSRLPTQPPSPQLIPDATQTVTST